MVLSEDKEEIVEKAASFVHAVNLKEAGENNNASASDMVSTSTSDGMQSVSHSNNAKAHEGGRRGGRDKERHELMAHDQEAPAPGILPNSNNKSATLDAAVVGTTSSLMQQATNQKDQNTQGTKSGGAGGGSSSGGQATSKDRQTNGGGAGAGAAGGGDEEGSAIKFSSTILPQHVAATAQQLLPTSVLRNLYDKLYEKRKAAALEVEQIVKSLAGAGDLHRVHALLSLLVRDYALSPLSNHRKGGLIGLAAATVGLVGNFATFLPLIIPPVLRSFDDTDSRVRYYACEALYNMAKVARDDFATFFNDVFDALCKLSADVDPNVQNAAHLLDKLVKDIVTESPHFDLEEFIALLRQRLQVSNPYVRQFLVSWISVLDSVPDIDMLEYLPEFLDGLLSMLSDPNRDIRQQADAALGEFLAEIKHIQRTAESKTQVVVPFDVRSVVRVLVERADNSDEFTQLTALAWLHDFVGLFGVQLVAYFDHLLDAVLPCLSHTNLRMSQVAETTNKALLELDTSTSSNMFDPIATIRVIKKHLEVCTKVSVPHSDPNTPRENQTFPYGSSISRQTRPELILPDTNHQHHHSGNHLRDAQDGGERTWLEALRWLSILLQRNHEEVLSMLDELLPLLFAATADGSETVVLKALEVEASIAKDTPEFQRLVAALLDRFRGEKGTQLLQSRGSLVIRRLCALLGSEKVYSTVSTLLVKERDLPFASTMVQALNLILLTAPELKQPRDTLKNVYHLLHNHSTADHAQNERPKELFESLYRSFSHSCCAVLSLCLHAGAYSHACDILNCLGVELELTTQQLMEMDRLVQLIESPMFTGTRMKLLEPAKYPALCKCFYGILTLLPQSKAFDTLHRRVKSIPSVELVRLNELIAHGPDLLHKKTGGGLFENKSKTRKDSSAHHHNSNEVIPFERLLHVFYTCQQKHSKLYREKLTETSKGSKGISL